MCTACADACLSEDTVADLVACVRTNLDCADICATTARHADMHEHCRICAEAYRAGERACRDLLSTMS